MKHLHFIKYLLHPGKAGSIGHAAVAVLLLGVFFLFCVDVAAVSAVNNCTKAQMAKCSGCAVGSICCSTTGGCAAPGAKNCAGMTDCGKVTSCTADACKTLPRVPDCTKAQMAKCSGCAVGSICCADSMTCGSASAADCTGMSCGNSSGTCSANACTVVPKIGDCTQAQMGAGCNGCATGVVCCADSGSCAPATQADCMGMSCGNSTTYACNSNACSTVDLACPKWTHTFTFKNSTAGTKVWLAAIPSCRKNGTCSQEIAEPAGGWGISAGGEATVSVPACWSGGFILRQGCGWELKNGVYTCGNKSPCCDIGDCINKDTHTSAYSCNSGGEAPVTRIEMTLDGGYTTDGVKINSLLDYYDISFVDGWTLMATMEPTGTKIWNDTPPDGKGADFWCKQGGCSSSAVTCPDKLVKCKVDGQTKTALGCWSPAKYAAQHKDDEDANKNKLFPAALRANLGCVCNAETDVLCNIGSAEKPVINPNCNKGDNTTFGCSPYSEPGTSNTNSQCCPWASTDTRSETCGWGTAQSARVWPQWARDYVSNIKTACPKAYAWQYDDMSSTYRCQAKNLDQGVNYLVTIHDVTLSSAACK